MCLFKKNKKINWPNLVFGLIAVGIIVACLILLVILYNKTGKQVKLVDTSRFEAEKALMQKKVILAYVGDLRQLKQDAQGLKNWDETYSLVEKEIFSLHVPQQYLDKHLQSWISISKLNDQTVTDKKGELMRILDELIAGVK